MPPASRPQPLALLQPDTEIGRGPPVAHGGGTERAPVPRISLWRTPRARSLVALGVLAAVAAVVWLLAHVYTDLLWFRELGQERVFWTTLKWKVLGHGVPGFGTACALLVNFAAVERVMARHAPRRPNRRLAYPVVAVIAGVLASEWRGAGTWRLLALWAGRSDFGVGDPLFHRDVGFFVFSLPLYQEVARWLLETLALAAVATVAAYLATGGLRRGRPFIAVRAARSHLLTLAGLGLLVVAWRYRLDQFSLALPHDGSVVPGASYTDVHVRLPAQRALVVLALAGAALCLYAAWRRVPRVPAVIVATAAGLVLVGQSALPGAIERFDVQPQQLSRERRYLADAIASTRRAFALDDITTAALPAGDRLSARDIAAGRRTVDNVPLWDSTVLRPAMNELQSIGRYYSFPRTTVDRYTVDGVSRLVTLAARQLDRARLGRDARSWANDRFAYTHGYGVVALRAGARQPQFTQRDFRSSGNLLRVREPRIYFGEQPDADPPYVVVNSRRGEIDQPISGSRAPEYHYDGGGGISLSNPLRRAAFAARFGDLKLLLTETVTGRSRIVLHRDVGERLRTLAPFLRWDAHAQTAVVDGRVQYLFHGYTTSTHYPYAARVRMGEEQVNYARAAAAATVDAFSGRVSIYAVDTEDPILRAWRSAYPSLFLDGSQLPRDVRAHLRYPRALFLTQARAYATYHAADPTGFWNGADAWELPRQLAGPVEGVGEIHFPKGRADVDENADAARWHMPASYLFARLTGAASERLMLVTPFTPRGRENLVGYLAGSVDRLGRPRLTVLSLPRDRLTVGPTQATRRILADAQVNRRLELLNRESRDLGRGAVNRTILGDARSVPIGDTLVHVQPIYLVAGGSGVPRLQLVTAYADGRVGYGPDLAAALRRIAP